jgi:large subunit ribosomal protein L21
VRLEISGDQPVYAIIEDRGTQMKVAPGDVIDIDLHPAAHGDEAEGKKKSKKAQKLTFDRVLMVGDAGSEKAPNLGKPYISGATVDAEVLEEVKGEKLDVIMYKRRKGQHRKIGHRQSYLRVKITGINA